MFDPPPSQWPHMSLRERKKLETREKLSMCALRGAIEHGIHNLRVEDIAAAAGVSARTFNNYFASKYEAIAAIALDRADRVGALMRERPADEPLWTSITHAVTAQYLDVPEAEARQLSLRSQELFTEPVMRGEYLKARQAMCQTLAEVIAERLGTNADDDVAPHIIAAAVDTAVNLAITRWRAIDPPARLVPMMSEALREASNVIDLP